jgi:hypothetical protein
MLHNGTGSTASVGCICALLRQDFQHLGGASSFVKIFIDFFLYSCSCAKEHYQQHLQDETEGFPQNSLSVSFEQRRAPLAERFPRILECYVKEQS